MGWRIAGSLFSAAVAFIGFAEEQYVVGIVGISAAVLFLATFLYRIESEEEEIPQGDNAQTVDRTLSSEELYLSMRKEMHKQLASSGLLTFRQEMQWANEAHGRDDKPGTWNHYERAAKMLQEGLELDQRHYVELLRVRVLLYQSTEQWMAAARAAVAGLDLMEKQVTEQEWDEWVLLRDSVVRALRFSAEEAWENVGGATDWFKFGYHGVPRF